MSDWKVLGSSNLFQNPILQLKSERIQRADGREVDWTVVAISSGVAVLPLHDNGDLVLISQYRPALSRRLWELPAGRVEEGETPLQAGGRELQEEAGFTGSSLEMLHTIAPLAGICRHEVHLILGRGLSPCATRHEPNEDILIQRFSPAEIVGMIQNGEINCGIALGALAQYFCLSTPE